MPHNFDEKIDRRGSRSYKWDDMEATYGVSPDDGLPMWVADTDFKPPQAVNDAVVALADHGIHGYYEKGHGFRAAVIGWMQRRHNWTVETDQIKLAHGLGAAIALCIQAFTDKSDGIIIFTPVYPSFAKYIKTNNRNVVESLMVNVSGRYEIDFAALQNKITGKEKMLVMCSPHNPAGRVWTCEELRAVAAFCTKNDIILVSDEIHHDIVYPPHKHTTMPVAAPEARDRTVVLVAPSKTFNIAGGATGCVIIQNDALRARYEKVANAAGYTANRYGVTMATAAYEHGDSYVDELVEYLTENHRIFSEGVNKIPGLKSMPLEATYLAWVDFSGTGMAAEDYKSRVEKTAKIATNYGETFGTGGENFLRFNIGCRREMVIEAVKRLQDAFSDLQ